MSRSTQQAVLAVAQEELLLPRVDLVLRDPERTLERAHGYDWHDAYWRVRVRKAEEIELERRVDRFAGGGEHEVEAVIPAFGVS